MRNIDVIGKLWVIIEWRRFWSEMSRVKIEIRKLMSRGARKGEKVASGKGGKGSVEEGEVAEKSGGKLRISSERYVWMWDWKESGAEPQR